MHTHYYTNGSTNSDQMSCHFACVSCLLKATLTFSVTKWGKGIKTLLILLKCVCHSKLCKTETNPTMDSEQACS